MIDSPANTTVKLLRSLETPRVSREQGLFVVEGVRLMEDALASGRMPRICLYNPELLWRTERGEQLLSKLKSVTAGKKESEVVEASERALASAASTQHTQGLVAAFDIPTWPQTPTPTAGWQQP